MNLPHDHNELLAAAYAANGAAERRIHGPTLLQTGLILVLLSLLGLGVIFWLDISALVAQIATTRELIDSAVAAPGPHCRNEIIDGIKIEHCIRTVARY